MKSCKVRVELRRKESYSISLKKSKKKVKQKKNKVEEKAISEALPSRMATKKFRLAGYTMTNNRKGILEFTLQKKVGLEL